MPNKKALLTPKTVVIMKLFTSSLKYLLFTLLNPIFLQASSVPGTSATSASGSQSVSGQQPSRQGQSDPEEKDNDHKEQELAIQQPQITTIDQLAKELIQLLRSPSLGEICNVMDHLDLLLADLPLLEAIDEGDRSKIAQLIKSKKCDVNAPDVRGPFLLALNRFNFDRKDLPALLQCCIEKMKHKRPKPLTASEIQDIKKSWHGFTPIMKAAAAGDKDLVIFYMDESADYMKSICFDTLINIKDGHAIINGRALVCALERDINQKKHTFDDAENQKIVPEQIRLIEAFISASENRDSHNARFHIKHCVCCGTFELTKSPDALQLAAIGGHSEVVELLLNTIMSKQSDDGKWVSLSKAIHKLLAWSMVAQNVDTKTAHILYTNSGIPIEPKTGNYHAIMRSLVEKFIPECDPRSPAGITLIRDALECGTTDMFRAICEALAEKKLENEWEQRIYDHGQQSSSLIYSINNVEKIAILLAADSLASYNYAMLEAHTIPYRVGLALLNEVPRNPKLLYGLKQYVRRQLDLREVPDEIPREVANRISNTCNDLAHVFGYGQDMDLSSQNLDSLRSVLNSCMDPIIYNNKKADLRNLLMDGGCKSLAIKQIINQELAHRPIDITTPSGLRGVPLFSYFDDESGQKRSTMFLLSSGEPAAKPIAPAVYQLCYPRFALEGLKDQHARTEIFMRGIQTMRNKLNEYLLPDLTTIVEGYASLYLPATVIQHFLNADDEQLMLQERILTLPKQCQRRIAQLYVGSKKYAAKLINDKKASPLNA